MLFNLENALDCFDIIFGLLCYLLFFLSLALFQTLDTLIKWKWDPVFRMFVLFRILDCVQSAESSIPNCDVPLLDPFRYYFFFVSGSWSRRIFSEFKFMVFGSTG